MPGLVQLKVDDRQLRRDMARLGKDAQDGRRPLTWFYQLWKSEVARAWSRVLAAGGTFRGKRWAGMKPQYTRADGPVPAWGGVDKVRGRGQVQGKLRPSLQRVKKSSVMMADTKELMGSLLSNRPNIIDRRILRIGGADLRDYAEEQFVANKRNPLFFTASDKRAFERFVRRYLDELARRFNRG